MNYLIALQERGLKTEQLSTAIRKKIKQAEDLSNSLSQIDAESLDVDGLVKYNVANMELEQLDKFITQKITSFNLDKYQKRVDAIKKASESNSKINNKGKVDDIPAPSSNSSGVERETTVDTESESIKPVVKEQVDTAQSINTESNDLNEQNLMTGESKPYSEVKDDIDKRVEEVSKVIKEELPSAQNSTSIQHSEFEEYKPTKEKKKNKGLAYGLIGAGVLLITFGAVQLNKD